MFFILYKETRDLLAPVKMSLKNIEEVANSIQYWTIQEELNFIYPDFKYKNGLNSKYQVITCYQLEDNIESLLDSFYETAIESLILDISEELEILFHFYIRDHSVFRRRPVERLFLSLGGLLFVTRTLGRNCHNFFLDLIAQCFVRDFVLILFPSIVLKTFTLLIRRSSKNNVSRSKGRKS